MFFQTLSILFTFICSLPLPYSILFFPCLASSYLSFSAIFWISTILYYTHLFTSSVILSPLLSTCLLLFPLLSFPFLSIPLPFSSTLLNIILIYAILFDRTSLTLCCFQFEIIEYRSSLTSERCN